MLIWTTGLPSHSTLPVCGSFYTLLPWFLYKNKSTWKCVPLKTSKAPHNLWGKVQRHSFGLPALWWEPGQPHPLLLPALNLVLLFFSLSPFLSFFFLLENNYFKYVGFCQISSKYTYFPSLLSVSPTLHPIPRLWLSQSAGRSSLPLSLAICSTRDSVYSVYVSMLLSPSVCLLPPRHPKSGTWYSWHTMLSVSPRGALPFQHFPTSVFCKTSPRRLLPSDALGWVLCPSAALL